jgi:multidrug resistance efflux pump
MKTKSIVLNFLFITAVGILLTACSQNSAFPEVTPSPAGNQTTSRLIFEGEAIPLNYVTLSFPVNGIIDEVLVFEGDQVRKGDIIARLNGVERQKAAVTASKAELLAAQQALDDLKENANVTRAEKQLQLAQAKKLLDKALENRNYKNYSRADQWYIDQSQADYLLALNDFDNAKTVWENWQDKDETDRNRAFALQNFAAARKKVQQAEANLNYLKASPPEVDVEIAEGELVVAKANYEKALSNWELVKNGPNPNDLQLAEERLVNAQAQSDAAIAAMKDLELIAPFDGTVVSSNIKKGQLASVGVSTVIIADLAVFQVESNDLTEINISRISEGDQVSIAFDGIPGLELTGIIERIKPIGEDNQGDITYSSIIKLDQQDNRIKWRMTASIISEN